MHMTLLQILASGTLLLGLLVSAVLAIMIADRLHPRYTRTFIKYDKLADIVRITYMIGASVHEARGTGAGVWSDTVTGHQLSAETEEWLTECQRRHKACMPKPVGLPYRYRNRPQP